MKDNIKPEGSHYDILLIEDDLATVRLVKNYFESEGATCKVHFYKTYRKGIYFFQNNKIVFLPKKLEGILKEIEKNPPKVVLLKIILSDVSGYEICKKIKSNQKLKHIPVFFFTTMPGSEVEKHLAETKADGYINKPFNFNDFDIIFDLLNLQKNNESTKNSITPRLIDEEIEKLGIVKDNIKPEDEFRKEREWLKIQFGEYNPDYTTPLNPTAEKQINQYITLKLENGKTYIYVNGKKFIQCIRLILNIQKEEIPIYDEIESIDEAVKVYENYIYQNGIVQGPMAAPIRGQNYIITPEQEFWGHCSNIQAWVENNYDTRILISNLSFSLLRELVRVGDPIAKRVYKEEIALRLETGYPSVVQYLLNQGYIKVFTLSEFKSIIEATDIIKNLSSSPYVLIQFLRSCFHQFPTLIEDIVLQILELQNGKNIISLIIQKGLENFPNFQFGNRLLSYLESLFFRSRGK